MKALVLHEAGRLSLDDIAIDETLGPDDVRVAIRSVGICGSDIHYYRHGRIGGFIVREPMVLGHEASGTVIETGANVSGLKPGDRVCMEPGVPRPGSRAVMMGKYNLDPGVRFWATPPVHGCLRETVVHPAQFTFKLPDQLSYDEGALMEPLSVGLQAVSKARVSPGDTALVTGCGTIGLMTALAARAAGCGKVIISDVVPPKLDLAATYGFIPVNLKNEDLVEVVKRETGGWGAEAVFEASGNEKAAAGVLEPLCPGGTVVFIGMPGAPVALDIVAAQAKEARMATVFRYAHQYPRAIALVASGTIDVKPLVTDRYAFEDAVRAFEYAARPEPRTVKTIIELAEAAA